MTVDQGSMLGLVGADTPVPYTPFGGTQFVDHVNDRVFQRELGQGVKQLAGGTTGTETLQATEVDIFGPGPPFTMISNFGCYHPMGKLFLAVTPNQVIAKIDGTTLVSDEIIGTGNATPSTCDAITGVVENLSNPARIIPMQRGAANFIISRGQTGASKQKEVTVINVTTTGSPLLLSAVRIAEASFSLGPGPSNSSTASFYVMGHDYAGVGPTFTLYRYDIIGNAIDPANVYTLPNEAVTATTLAVVVPSDIDPAWATMGSISGPGYDQADGNPIFGIKTSDAVANQYYLVKMDGSTGAILWKVPVVTAGIVDFLDYQGSLYNGTLPLLYRPITGATSFVLIYDLSDGSVTQQTWNRGLTMDAQIFDPATGGLTGHGGYTQGAGPVPTYLGAYLAANGNAIPPNRFSRLYLGVAPAPGPPVTPGRTSYNRLWGNYP